MEYIREKYTEYRQAREEYDTVFKEPQPATEAERGLLAARRLQDGREAGVYREREAAVAVGSARTPG